MTPNHARHAPFAAHLFSVALCLAAADRAVGQAQSPNATNPCVRSGQEEAGVVAKVGVQGCCAFIERPRPRGSSDRLPVESGAVLCTEDKIIVTDAAPGSYVLLQLSNGGSVQYVPVQASRPYTIYHTANASSALDADDPR